eukprot:GHVU01113474.1.p2 GENE.GHVU01113474.1~~GHVU01113474.1.p2  ORF type:complete len:118 (+),score=4.27 GHVU01113474.1:259-612(+)
MGSDVHVPRCACVSRMYGGRQFVCANAIFIVLLLLMPIFVLLLLLSSSSDSSLFSSSPLFGSLLAGGGGLFGALTAPSATPLPRVRMYVHVCTVALDSRSCVQPLPPTHTALERCAN